MRPCPPRSLRVASPLTSSTALTWKSWQTGSSTFLGGQRNWGCWRASGSWAWLIFNHSAWYTSCLLCFAFKQGTNGILQTWKKKGEEATTKDIYISHCIKLLHMHTQQFPYTFHTLQIIAYMYAMFLLYLIFLLQQWTYGFKPFTLFLMHFTIPLCNLMWL